MSEITFIIHLRKDTEERAKNVDIVTSYYRSILPDSKFIVIEDDKSQNFKYLEKEPNISYIHNYNEGQHNKSKSYNIGLNRSKTGIICFLDIDCIISKQNIEKCIETLKQPSSICIGYNGVAIYFKYDVKNKITDTSESLYEYLAGFIDRDNIYIGYTNSDYHVANTKAVGGALFGYREVFKSIGGFNPNFKGWGYEDNEIIVRAKKLGIDIFFINTSKPYLLHLPHIDPDYREDSHPSYKLNEQEFLKINRFTKSELEEYIKSWK